MIKELEKIEFELNRLYEVLPGPSDKNYSTVLKKIETLLYRKWNLLCSKNRIDINSLHI